MRKTSAILGLLVCCLCSLNCAYGYTFSIYEPPELAQNGTISYPKITRLENIILKKTFEDEDIEARLKRLEQKTFSRTYSGSDLAWRVDNITNKIDQSELYNIPSKELASIEKRILGKSFKKDNLDSRLSRLEYQMLGATQSGKPDERFETILTASQHYNNFDSSISNPLNNFSVTSMSPVGGVKNTFRNIFNTITSSGSMTGYTPPVSPYGYAAPYGFDPRYGTFGPRNPLHYYNNPYNSNFGYNPTGYQRSIRTNRGYYNTNRSYGSGMGVRILD